MIIDCISDLHGCFFELKLKGGDLLIIAGDLTARDTEKEYDDFWAWLSYQNYKFKIVVAGNHDKFLEKNPTFFDDCGKDINYLCDKGCEFEGLKIWGSPWTKRFIGQNPYCMAFTKENENELAEKWSLIINDTDILITHSPPYGILDKTKNNKRVGSKSLLNALWEKISPKLLVCGHIHESYGIEYEGGIIENAVNASLLNENYKFVNKPIKINL